MATVLTSLNAEEPNSPKFSGVVFGDYYNMAVHHDSSLSGSNGFWFRRIHFTYDHDINDDFSVRLRFEVASPGDFSKKSTTMNAFIKDAYLKYKISAFHEAYLGISASPTFGIIDKTQGYRFLEKSPLDLQRWASSRDCGLAFMGKLNQTGTLKYHFFFGNGEGEKTEIDEGKKVSLAVSAFPTECLILEAYVDWYDKTNVSDWYTYHAFAAWKTKTTTISLLGATQIRKNDGGGEYRMDLGSLFFSHFFSQNWGAVVRVDRMFDPNPDAQKIAYLSLDPIQKSTLVIAGIDYLPAKGIHFTPNVEMVFYDEKSPGNKDDKDIVPRFTFSYSFK